MSTLRFAWTTVLGTLLRMLPLRAKTGLVAMGNPGPDAPVFLTGNFRLTVERVKRALRGLDAYLVVADSGGVNVWCAATGGLFTNHDVVSALKTTGIADRVDHRRVILPQLAATGIEGSVVRESTGWRVVWGPVDARDIPAFLAAGRKATPAMREVRFPFAARLEMAIAWAFPISAVGGLVVWSVWPAGVLPVLGLVWVLALALFLGFPLYEGRLRRRLPGDREQRRVHRGFVLFDFGERGVPLVLWALFMVLLVAGAWIAGSLTPGFVACWGMASLVAVAILGLDLTGSTPGYKSGLHSDRLLGIRLDADRCTAAGFCERVCPVRVFEVDHHLGTATLPGKDRCVQCGACIVQCPFDALYFESPSGDVITPDTIRRFKLNLLGHRTVERVKTGSGTAT